MISDFVVWNLGFGKVGAETCGLTQDEPKPSLNNGSYPPVLCSQSFPQWLNVHGAFCSLTPCMSYMACAT